MTSEKVKKTKVTIFLLKEGREKPDDFLTKKITGIKIDDTSVVYPAQIPTDTPKWADTFFLNIDAVNKLHKASAGAIVKTVANTTEGEKHFLISFGYGYHQINPGACVDRFGIKVALNSGNLTKIRSLDKRNLSSTPKLSREQLATLESIQSFGVDYDQDMMQGVTLISADEEFGQSITGGVGVSFSTPRNINNIAEILPKIYTYYTSGKYKTEEYDWIDNISPVSASSEVAELNVELINQVNKHTQDNQTVVLSVPEIQEWHDVQGFSPDKDDPSKIVDEITLESVLPADKEGNLVPLKDIKQVKNRKIYMWSAESDSAIRHWSLYRCITAEILHNKNKYILSNGKWYKADASYAKDIDEWYSKLAIEDMGLPTYKKVTKKDKTGKNIRVHDEGAYNESLTSKGYMVLDKKYVSTGQHKNIEVCDLYKDKTFIHVKVFTGSSAPISHLLAQATVSSELFFGEQQFREKLNKKLPTAQKLSAKEIVKAENNQFKIKLAVVTNKDELALPFFSKINLRATLRRFQIMSIDARVVRIPGDFS